MPLRWLVGSRPQFSTAILCYRTGDTVTIGQTCSRDAVVDSQNRSEGWAGEAFVQIAIDADGYPPIDELPYPNNQFSDTISLLRTLIRRPG